MEVNAKIFAVKANASFYSYDPMFCSKIAQVPWRAIKPFC
jgi:hypothetical protein